MKRVPRLILLPLVLTTAFLFTSCTIWNAQQWERFNNPSFHFQKFTYYLKGADRRTAFEFIRDFPVEDALRVVAEKHSIEIDSAEFRAFTENPDNERRIAVFGVMITERF
ncbi:MAG: hypothetical protein EHM32_12805, partial [Spirochaetales bacterium]